MPAYVIGEVKILKPDELGAYGRMVAEAVARYGGRYLARGAEPFVFEGGPAHNVLLIEFPDGETARKWYASPEYQAAKKLREGKTNLRLCVIEP
ncbi:hypothetical protein PIGHUM_01853 [Pigmentiphaga humi]|uniref:DUF1330 domain-containing protein n=1 Tax=Pigmentiphaga humi TaxID=2478468 RepID=A0A3P4B2C3_9BURK|nr:DUF1330 domain-containing protein [Pigmentiphaga humi]VCU69788.1 hypothetical protein PIGHUM_01853 [Pigmentiphaga humi]